MSIHQLPLGLLEAIAAMAAFFFVLRQAGWSWGTTLSPNDPLYRLATTACLTAIVLMQVMNVHLCRTRRAPFRSRRFFGNHLITIGIATELALILLIDYTSVGNAIFLTAPVPWRAWGVVLPFAFAMLLLEEWRKRSVRGRQVVNAGTRERPSAERL